MTFGRALVVALLVTAMVVTAVGMPLRQWLVEGADWAEHHRYSAAGLFIVAYTVAAVLAVPGTILTLAAGFVFGLALGAPLVSAGSLLGATAAFLIGRFYLGGWVERRIARSLRLQALAAVTRHDGFTIVLLARLSPLLPYNVLNYMFGLSAVRFRDYILASWIGMLPATLVYVYIGSLTKTFVASTGGGLEAVWPRRVLLVTGLFATVGFAALISRRATRELRDRLATEERAAAERSAQ
jgi:uncharacterized membrane protein YdjX (TVP38/TMEM64 family)